MNTSQMTRSGRIASAISAQKLKNPDGTLTPLLFFDVCSRISLGAEILEETAKVLLCGETLCEAFRSGQPKEGDEVVLLGAVAYVRNGVLCLRPSMPEQIRHYGSANLNPRTDVLDVSNMTRSGQIASKLNCQKLESPDGTLTPLLFFELSSRIDLGEETLDERTNVLLQGEEFRTTFMSGQPKMGDAVDILCAVAYVRNGCLCLRPSCAQHVSHQGHGEGTSYRETFGLSKEDFIKATQLFRK